MPVVILALLFTLATALGQPGPLPTLESAEPLNAPRSNAPRSLDGDVELLVQRRLAHQTRLALIANETRELRYNTFIFGLDETGRSTLGALVDAATRGVKVKLIVDGFHLENLARYRHTLQALMDLGVEVRVFNPVYRHPLSINNRNHMKSLIGTQEMIVGGRNTQNHYFREYIDVEAHVRGPTVQSAASHYDEVFNSPHVRAPVGTSNLDETLKARRDLLAWAREFRMNRTPPNRRLSRSTDVEDIRYIGDPADPVAKRTAGLNQEIVAMINRAERSLEFVNPYVLMSPEVEEAIRRARARGVRVSVMTNSSATTDSGLVARAWEIKREHLLEMGVEVYESTQNYVHAKTIIRDGREVFIGSFNLDMRSFNLNLENGIFTRSRTLARNLNRHQERLRRMFTTRGQVTPTPQRTILQQGGECIRSGMNRLITSIVYPIL
jgi:putative cardiolipin synthase